MLRFLSGHDCSIFAPNLGVPKFLSGWQVQVLRTHYVLKLAEKMSPICRDFHANIFQKLLGIGRGFCCGTGKWDQIRFAMQADGIVLNSDLTYCTANHHRIWRHPDINSHIWVLSLSGPSDRAAKLLSFLSYTKHIVLSTTTA